jgi:putative RNA 2'-phosphotransferase
MKKASKFLALVLRHKPEVADLTLDAEGWAPVADVLRALRSRFGEFSRTQLQELVDTNDKKRFAFNERGDKIRASQGHSVADVMIFKPEDAETPPDELYHGTKKSFLGLIFKDGLKPGTRQHVHLSRDVETANVVAARRSGESVILKVNAKLMSERSSEQHLFYRSENGVWLTDRVPPAYIEVLPENA